MISVSLWENAYDSLDHGLDHLEKAVGTGNAYDYKRVVLDFCHAAELLLKEILYRKNPIYAFDKNDLFKKCNDPLNPTLEELYNCKSLEVNPLCEAIKKYVPEFNANLKVYSGEASKLRNKIQHFCYSTTNDEVRRLLLKLSYQLLCPAFTYLNTNQLIAPLQKRLYEVFHIDEILNYHKGIMQATNEDFEIGFCYSCGSLGLFIIYDGYGSYPKSCECVACTYTKKNIQSDDFHECPECSANSLIYAEELDGGICLWYKCANNRDGGILTPMFICDICHEYRIEEVCNCNNEKCEV